MGDKEEVALPSAAREHFLGGAFWAGGDWQMSTGSRFGRNGELSASVGLSGNMSGNMGANVSGDGPGTSDAAGGSLAVDERTAIYLLSLARELLRRDHSAIAGMIDYAIAEIESGPGDTD